MWLQRQSEISRPQPGSRTTCGGWRLNVTTADPPAGRPNFNVRLTITPTGVRRFVSVCRAGRRLMGMDEPQAIVRDLAQLSPVVDSDLGDYCGLCGKVSTVDDDLMVPASHEPHCVW